MDREKDESEKKGATESELQIPLDVICSILQHVSPAMMVVKNWDSVCHSFALAMNFVIKHKQTYSFTNDEYIKNLLLDKCETGRTSVLIQLILKKYLGHVRELVVPVNIFSLMQQVLEPDIGKGMHQLRTLTVQMGGRHGGLKQPSGFAKLGLARSLATLVKGVNLDIVLDEDEQVSCCALRELVRYLLEITTKDAVWNVTLEDDTDIGQGYIGPVDLTKLRDKTFICFVRTLLDLGVSINRLNLLDRKKLSPYMLVAPRVKRRTLYMYPEYKNCHSLVICYDIGLVAPMFAHENDVFEKLNKVEVYESHVLYKKDLLEFLRNAQCLADLRIVLPGTWCRRVANCSRGCFTSQDYSCFRADGWCQVHEKLPTTRFELVQPQDFN